MVDPARCEQVSIKCHTALLLLLKRRGYSTTNDIHLVGYIVKYTISI